MTGKITKILKRWEQRRGEKGQWHQHYDDLARVMLPRRLGFSSTLVEGERRTDDIFDGTPMQAARGLANAIGGLLRPQGIPEVKMKAEDDAINAMEEAKAWFADSEEKLKSAFNNPKARFRHAAGETDLAAVVLHVLRAHLEEHVFHPALLVQQHHHRGVAPPREGQLARAVGGDGDTDAIAHGDLPVVGPPGFEPGTDRL